MPTLISARKQRTDLEHCTYPDELRRLTARPAEDESELWDVACIRNVCRYGYSYDRETIITREQQQAWWAAQEGRAKAWLFYDLLDEGWMRDLRLVGFGMLRPYKHGDLTTVCGVLPEARGHDYGIAIIRYLVHRATLATIGMAAVDNPAAVRLHDPAHWDEIDPPDPHVRAFEARLGFGGWSGGGHVY